MMSYEEALEAYEEALERYADASIAVKLAVGADEKAAALLGQARALAVALECQAKRDAVRGGGAQWSIQQ